MGIYLPRAQATAHAARPPQAVWPTRLLARSLGAVMMTRGSRVLALVAAIVVLSVIDLYLTLMFLTHGGMLESNPIARLVMSYGSPMTLGVWKLASVSLAAFILLRARRHRVAEIGAWIGVLVLSWLAWQWAGYVRHTGDLHLVAATLDPEYMRNATGGEWVSMAAPGLLLPSLW